MQFTFFCFLGFWCFHLFHLSLALTYPFKAKMWMDSSKIRMKFHITEVAIVFVCGIIPPIITIVLSNYQDNGLFCFPRSTAMFFYGQSLPNTVAFCIGLSLLFYSLWTVRKVSLINNLVLYIFSYVCIYVCT